VRKLVIPDSGVGSEIIDIKSRYDLYISAYNFAKGFFEKCREARESLDQTKEMKEREGHLLHEMQNSMACFVFCTICLESYINTYAGDRLPDVVW